MDMDMMNRSMTIMLQCNILMDMEILNQCMDKPAINQGMGPSSSMESNHHMACRHRDHLHNHMALLGLVNLEICLIKVLFNPVNHMVQMFRLSSSILMSLVGPCNNRILSMDLHQELMDTIRQCLLLVLAIHSKVGNQFHLMASLVDNRQLATCKDQLVVMDHIHLHNKVMQNRQLQTVQVMGIKALKILHTAVALEQPIVHHQAVSRLLLSQQQLNQLMISRFHSQVDMELLQGVRQLGMGKPCLPSLLILNMTQQPRCMLHRVENLVVA